MPVQIINKQKKLKTEIRRVKKVTEELLAYLGINDKTINILFTDDPGIREFNKRFLKKDYPTNVISFSYLNERHFGMIKEEIIGDIVISLERTVEEAKKAGCSFYDRLFSLIIHGILHVIGYDHEKDKKEGRRMRYMEKKLIDFVRSLPSYGGKTEFAEKKSLP